MSTKYNNATTEYDNNVVPSKKKGGLLSSLKSSLSSAMNTISGGAFSKLNKLADKFKGFDLSSFISKLGSKLSGMLKSYLNNAISMLKDMARDTLNQLKNAGKNFALNLAEQFYNDIKASMYIEDKIFVQTIKALYYSGADLAYNNHYIRENALTRDWNYTLEFLDSQYNVDYTLEYDKLETDLKKAAQNGCYKNIKYMFKKMLKARNTLVVEIASIQTSIDSVDYDSTQIKALTKTKTTLSNNKDKYDKLFVKYMKMLITYSYSSLSASKLKAMIKDTNGIVLPRYFGDTDNKYQKSYKFKEGDIKRMMPTFTQHKTTNTDKQTLQDIEDQQDDIEEEDDDLRADAELNENTANRLEEIQNGTSYSSESNWLYNNNENYTKETDKSVAYYKTQSKLETFRANYRDKQVSQNKALSVTALKKGSKAVVSDTRKRYHKNYDGSSVKYRASASDVLDSVFGDENEYITLRNNNIKSIYILLSSKSIYGNNCMVNELFYKRCKQKTMTSLRSSFDKAKGLLGASAIVQSLYDLSDIVEGSAYNYTKKVEDYLYDPKTNTEMVGGVLSGDFSGFNSLQFDLERNDVTLPVIDESTGTVVNTSNIEDAVKNPNNIQPPSDTSTVSNETTEKEVDDKLESDTKSKKKVLDITRYGDKIPIGTKRDMMVKYLGEFYNSILKRGISQDVASKCLANLVYKIIGRNNITNPNQLDGLFVNATNNTLTNNMKTFVSIGTLGLTNEYLGLSNYDSTTAKEIEDIYDLTSYAFYMEMKSVSFAKATFVYDNDYMHTLAKQKFQKELDQLNRLNNDGNTNRSDFYTQKDVLTKTYDGFDRFGIFGFDERSTFRVKYTNVETGDWNSICVGTEGTFFGGSTNTKNNGVRYLDDDTIKTTSKTSGNWEIFEKCDTTFFLDESGNIYTWNSGTKDLDLKLSKVGRKYNFVEFTKYGFIFANGIDNNGLLMYKDNSFIKLSNTGSNFKYFVDKNLLFFYTEEGSSPIIAIELSTGNYNKTSNESNAYTTPITYTINHKVTTTITKTDPETRLTTTSTSIETVYRHHILFGKINSNDIYDLVNETDSSSSYGSTWKTNSKINQMSNFQKPVHLVKLNKTILAIYENDDVNNTSTNVVINPNYNKSYTATSSGNTTSSPSSVIGSKIDDEYNSNGTESEYNCASNFYCINNNLMFLNTKKENDKTTITAYIHKKDSNSINKLSGITNYKTISYYNPNIENLELIFAKDSKTNDLYYLNSNTNSLSAIFNEAKYKITGWQYIPINRKYAQLYNKNASLGLLIYNNDTNKLINNNITTGNWKLGEGYKYYYAMSVNGTNSGVKYSKKGTFNFTNITEQNVSYYDIPAFAYDSEKKRFYCGVERSKCKLNISNINYDIDEYIYLNNVYQLYKHIESADNNKTDALIKEINDKLAGVDESSISTLSDKEISAGPVSGKEYFIKDETTGELTSVGSNLDSFESDETYYTKNEDSNSSLSNNGNYFSSLSSAELVAGPKTDTTYYTKDSDTGEMIEVGTITKFDSSKSYYTKVVNNSLDKVEKLTSEEISAGPVSGKEYFINKDNPSSTANNFNNLISVGTELTKFSDNTNYYKETNPIAGIPISTFTKLTNDEKLTGPLADIQYFTKNSNGEYKLIGEGNVEVKEFNSSTDYYTKVDNRTLDPTLTVSLEMVSNEEKNDGPIVNERYFILYNNETTNQEEYQYIGTGGDTLIDFQDSINYYTIKEISVIGSTNKSTSDILNEIKSEWDPYMDDLDEIEKSSPFYTDLVTASLANQEFNIDDKNMINGIELDLILGDEGKNSTNYLLLEDENKKFYISNEDKTYSNLKEGSEQWNMINEYSSIDFLNSDETDIANIPTNNN